MTAVAAHMTQEPGLDDGVKRAGGDPERRCAVCRAPRPRAALLRFVAGADERVYFDALSRAPGRGVSVCARLACLTKLRPQLPGVQALGVAGPFPGDFLQTLLAQIQQNVQNKLGLLWRQRRLVVGTEKTIAAIKQCDERADLLKPQAGAPALIVVAADAAPRTVEDLKRALGDRSVTVAVVSATVSDLGRALGKEVVAVVGVWAEAVARDQELLERTAVWAELHEHLQSAAAGNRLATPRGATELGET